MNEKPKIYAAISGIMNEIEAITKSKKNAQQGYSFRGIDDMYNAIQPLFKKHQVFITSNVLESKREERQTKSGGALIYTIAKCQFKFFTTDGSFVESVLDGEAMDSGDKSTNKAMSTALKYALMQMFLIPTEERLDTEYETHEIKPKEIEVNEIDKMCSMIYDSPDDLLLVLDSCETIKQISSLYNSNSKMIIDQKLKQNFTTKKEQIKNGK